MHLYLTPGPCPARAHGGPGVGCPLGTPRRLTLPTASPSPTGAGCSTPSPLLQRAMQRSNAAELASELEEAWCDGWGAAAALAASGQLLEPPFGSSSPRPLALLGATLSLRPSAGAAMVAPAAEAAASLDAEEGMDWDPTEQPLTPRPSSRQVLLAAATSPGSPAAASPRCGASAGTAADTAAVADWASVHSFVNCVTRSPLLKSALLALESTDGHPAACGAVVPARGDALRWTLAQLLAMHMRARLERGEGAGTCPEAGLPPPRSAAAPSSPPPRLTALPPLRCPRSHRVVCPRLAVAA